MTIEWLRRQFQHNKEHGDIPLLKTEAQGEIKRFSQEAIIGLHAEGYHIYTLTGKSIKDFRASKETFFSAWQTPEHHHEEENLASRRTDVAVDPEYLFLPETLNKSPYEQERLIDVFSQKLGKRIRGTKAILGSLPDYAELIFLHLKKTGRTLVPFDLVFPLQEHYLHCDPCIRTETELVGFGMALVGVSDGRLAIYYDWELPSLGRHHPSYVYYSVCAAPLVVPK